MNNLLSFLNHVITKKNLPQTSVFCFYGDKCPLLFFYTLISFLYKNNLPVKIFDVAAVEASLIKAYISTTSFSGSAIYYITGVNTLSSKKQEEWTTYFSSYSGPHTIIIFCTNTSAIASLQNKQTIDCIFVNDTIPLSDAHQIRPLIDSSSATEKSLLFSHLQTFLQHTSLDNICLFVHYEMVLGKNIGSFCHQWLPQIIEPTTSLFLLSQYFFAKKNSLFFEQWSYCSEMNLPPYWANFFSDQVWRAYIYCDAMQKKSYAEAKKAQYKLPYSFINRDWSALTLRELRNAHELLFRLDFRLKNGGASIGLEHFFGSFFENRLR